MISAHGIIAVQLWGWFYSSVRGEFTILTRRYSMRSLEYLSSSAVIYIDPGFRYSSGLVPFKGETGWQIPVFNQMLNIFYFTHLHTEMNPFLHKNSPWCRYFYWRLQTIYCAIVKRGLFLRYCNFEHNLPIHRLSHHTPKEATRKDRKVSIQAKRHAGYFVHVTLTPHSRCALNKYQNLAKTLERFAPTEVILFQ